MYGVKQYFEMYWIQLNVYLYREKYDALTDATHRGNYRLG